MNLERRYENLNTSCVDDINEENLDPYLNIFLWTASIFTFYEQYRKGICVRFCGWVSEKFVQYFCAQFTFTQPTSLLGGCQLKF